MNDFFDIETIITDEAKQKAKAAAPEKKTPGSVDIVKPADATKTPTPVK